MESAAAAPSAVVIAAGITVSATAAADKNNKDYDPHTSGTTAIITKH